MKLHRSHFLKDQGDHQTLQNELVGEMELSSADLEIVHGGGSCPGSNGFPYGGNPYYQGAGYNYGGNPYYQGAGYNYGGFSGNGYASGFNQLPPCQVPPPPCPYSSY